MPYEDIKAAIEGYIPENNRSQLVYKNSSEIILDAYNANPSSMKVAIENFVQLDKAHKVAILGDMFELGNESLHEHKEVVNLLSNQDDITCYFIGPDFYHNRLEKPNLQFYKTFDAFVTAMSQQSFYGKMLLIKGSRGMALERILELL